MAVITIKSGPANGATFSLKQGINRLGRADESDCQIVDPSVSKLHCEIVLDGNTARIKDLGSTNGTFINGHKIDETSLAGDVNLKLGSVELNFQNELAQSGQPATLSSTSNEPKASPGTVRIRVGQPAALSTTNPSGQSALPPISIAKPTPAQVSPAAGVPVPLSVGLARSHPAEETAPAASAPALIAGPDDCQNHIGQRAFWVCLKCGKQLCFDCVKTIKVGAKQANTCKGCSGSCIDIEEARKAPPKPLTFASAVGDAFKFPFRGNGLLLLIFGTLFFTFIEGLLSSRAASFVFFGKIMVRVTTYGYLFAYLQKIVVSAAKGEKDPPGWPEVTDISSDIIHPFWLMVATFAAAFGPAIFFIFQGSATLGYLFLGIGVMYLPMAILAVCMADSLSGLNPVVVLSAILKCPGAYLFICLIQAVLVCVRLFLVGALEGIDIPIVPRLIAGFIGFLLLTLEMRLLGVLYFFKRKELGWF